MIRAAPQIFQKRFRTQFCWEILYKKLHPLKLSYVHTQPMRKTNKQNYFRRDHEIFLRECSASKGVAASGPKRNYRNTQMSNFTNFVWKLLPRRTLTALSSVTFIHNQWPKQTSKDFFRRDHEIFLRECSASKGFTRGYISVRNSHFCGLFPLNWTSSSWCLPFCRGSLLPVEQSRYCCRF